LAVASLLLMATVLVPSASMGKTSPRRPLLTVVVSGHGKVTSTPKGLACRSKCRRRFPARKTVRLVAKASPQWSFWKWSGSCAKRKGAVCTVRMSTARSVRAVFRLTIAVKPTPHCGRTLSLDAQKVLAYLGRLTNGSEPGVIVGQDCPHGAEICDDDAYRRTIEDLYAVSGKWVGLLHVDYEYIREYTPLELSLANQRLIAHWRAGGLVAVSWGPANPWGTDPQHAYKDILVKYPLMDLGALLPGGGMRARWVRSLDRIAGALKELRDAGVVVLWRPMQEMNGVGYWWAKNRLEDKHEGYVRLWRDMFDYFTCVKGLDNLLWVFSPGGTQAWSSFPYPGDAYVDVVAGTSYGDDLPIDGYDDYLAYGKPAGIAEYGPGAGANGLFDDRLYIERLQRDYPRMAYWATWSSFADVKLALVDNLFASELMNDPGVITRDEIAWR
jgi:mannan endo-1,4-beta-mannosidase